MTTSTMMLRWLAHLPAIALLGIGLLTFSAVIRDLPVFNASQRVEGLFGDWRVPVAAALYNRSDYLFQIGFGYLQGDVVASSATEERDELASIETALQRAESARLALTESTMLAPGNAYTWSFLGWAYLMEGDLENSVAALETSWAVSPWNGQLAVSRINLVEVLVEIDEALLSNTAFVEAVGRDIRTLATYQARYLAVILSDTPALQAIAADILTDTE